MPTPNSRPIGDVVRLMNGPLSPVFADETWATWRTVLKASLRVRAEATTNVGPVELLTQRQTLPARVVRELWLLLGLLRSGKSIIAALLAVWATCCPHLSHYHPAKVGVFMVIASDRRQSRVVKRYIAGLLRVHPSLEALIQSETAEAIWLTNGLCIEIHSCSFRSFCRGYTCIGAAVDEVAFWSVEDSANPDKEVLVALRAAMASACPRRCSSG